MKEELDILDSFNYICSLIVVIVFLFCKEQYAFFQSYPCC